MSIKSISPQDLYRRMKLGHNVILIDVRAQSEFEKGHIPGATLYPLNMFDAQALIHKVRIPFPTPPTIYVACHSGSQSIEACKMLADAGYEYIVILEGGMRAWKAAGLPTYRLAVKPSDPQPLNIRQQMQIAVGAIVILGTLLGTFVNTGFLAISLLAGIGYAYEGLYGTHYLKDALLKMSWNRNL